MGASGGSSGGGSGTTVRHTSATIVSGNVTAQASGGAWQPLTGGPEITIAAATNDRVRLSHCGMIRFNTTYWDFAIVKGAGPSIVRYASTATSSPTAASEGHPALLTDPNFNPSLTVIRTWLVEANDLDAGNLRVQVVVRDTGGTRGILHASTNYPFYWELFNFGQ